MSRPGLSMWGKEGEPMTPQERADFDKLAVRIFNKLTVHKQDEMKHDYRADERLIAEALIATRRAALLEASKVAMTYGEQARDEDLSGSYTSELIVKALDRLAQEGA